MIAQGKEDVKRIEAERERAKREAEDKAAIEKKRREEAANKSKKSLFGRKK